MELLFARLVLSTMQNEKNVIGSLAARTKDTLMLKLACFGIFFFLKISMGIFFLSFFTLVSSLYIVFILQVKLISPSCKSRNWEHDVAFRCDQMPRVGKGEDSCQLCVRLWVDSRST